jgi:F0F1-type ATP synthase membrane subunit c/vacuolar-type H+-ATPase subunit K
VKIVLISLLVGVAGYVVGVVLGMLMVNLFSSNTHDKSLEAAMTSFFVYGPLAAVLSFIVTLVYLLSRRGR